jgi:hypothetical protein
MSGEIPGKAMAEAILGYAGELERKLTEALHQRDTFAEALVKEIRDREIVSQVLELEAIEVRGELLRARRALRYIVDVAGVDEPHTAATRCALIAAAADAGL